MKKNLFLFLFSICLANGQALLPHEKILENISNCSSEEIPFFNKTDNLVLSGTLIRPNSNFDKIVIIVPGSGKDTRNSHYKLAKNFIESNIAVYRFDDRGVGKSQGIYTNSIEMLSRDLNFCIANLRKIYKEKSIGVLGHSLGGMAAILTTQKLTHSSEIDFLVQLAVPVKNFSDAVKHQIVNSKVSNLKEKQKVIVFNSLIDIFYESPSLSSYEIYDKGLELIGRSTVKISEIQFWSMDHIELYRQDFETAYRNAQTPIFYIIGSKDLIVSPETEIQNLKKYNNSNISFLKLENLNHHLCDHKLLNSDVYDIDENVPDLIVEWLNNI